MGCRRFRPHPFWANRIKTGAFNRTNNTQRATVITSVSATPSAVTTRAVCIGVVCVGAICAVEAYNDYYVNNTWLGAHHFPIVAAFLMTFLILGVNGALIGTRYLRPLTAGELITIWCMMIVTASLPTLGLAAYLLPTLAGLTYYATPENDWAELFHHYIPSWVVPTDSDAARGFFEGLFTSDVIPWAAWVKPLIFWTLFTFTLWGVMVCLSTILRKQWVEREKFAFPLVQLPAQMGQPPEGVHLLNSFFRTKAMWVAFAVPVVIHSISTLHFYYPVFPEMPLRFSTRGMFVESPWHAVRPLDLNIQPSTIGLSYLMSLEVSFSLWVFYLIYKIERVVGEATALSPVLYHNRFVSHREMGAYLVLVGFFIFIARYHFRDVLHKTLRQSAAVDDTNEPLPYRWTILGLIGGLLGLSTLMMIAGAQTFWLMLSVMLFFGVVCVVDAWLVTRGLFFIHGSFKAPDLFVTALGTSRFGAANLTLIAFPKRVFFRDRREILMPHLVNSFKISDEANLNRRHLLGAICIALGLGTAVSLYAYLKLAYTQGAVTLGRTWIHTISPREPFRELESFLTNPQDTHWQRLTFVFSGGVVMLFLLVLRYQFIWWPLHPIGFITPGQFPMNNIWFSIFLGWLFKYLVIQHGGFGGYRRARPVFLGAVLGEATIAGISATAGLFTTKGYNFLYF